MQPGELTTMYLTYETFMKRAFKSTDTAKNIKLHGAVVRNLINTRDGLALKKLGTYEDQFLNMKLNINKAFDMLISNNEFKRNHNELNRIRQIIADSESVEQITDQLSKVNQLTRV